jgi:hypothetical protein
MFVGKHEKGKHEYARALERALFDAGRSVYMLDGKNVLLGIDHDLWVDAALSELVRRFGEVVHLLLNAGLIVVSTTERDRPGRRRRGPGADPRFAAAADRHRPRRLEHARTATSASAAPSPRPR